MKKKADEDKRKNAPRRRKIVDEKESDEGAKGDVIINLCTGMMEAIKDFKVEIFQLFHFNTFQK